MIFNRKIYSKIVEWNDNQSNNSALLIEGARRVGKTTICEKFAKDVYFDNYLIVDFMYASNRLLNIFDDISDLNDFFSNLFLLMNKTIKNGGLIIFDEIQRCPKARQAIKLLIKDGRFHYIETGSLISIRENIKDITIPSEEKRIEMYPMDFEEFLWAFNKNDLVNDIKNAYLGKFQLNNASHEVLLKEYRKYIALGGMPKVIDEYLKTLSYKNAHEVKDDILKLYVDDLHKHDLLHGTNCERIYSLIPSMLNESSRFILSNNEFNRYSAIKHSLDDLVDSKMVYKINKITDPSFGFELSKVDSFFKLYSCDTGLLVTSILKNNNSVDEIYKKIILDKSDMNFGKIYESFVAQSLIANGITPYYHTYSIILDNKEKNYEIDFIAIIKGTKTAIEVKTGKNFSTSSLDNLKNKYKSMSYNKIVISSKPYQRKNDVTYIPIYMVFCL